jgi:hypothetical protein
MTNMSYSIHLFCAANSDAILKRDLLRSPEIASGSVPISIIRNAKGASIAYHDAIEHADADILIFAHQDIYFPAGWFAKLKKRCECLSSCDPYWAVAGVYGVKSGGEHIGQVWDSALGYVCGKPFADPEEVVSLDEVVLIVRRGSGVNFDPTLKWFHLYGTDIVLEAKRAGLKSYVINLPIIHNTRPSSWLDRNYSSAYHFMVRKWRSLLPWPTVIVRLTTNPLMLLTLQLRLLYKAVFKPHDSHPPLDHPEKKALELGFSDGPQLRDEHQFDNALMPNGTSVSKARNEAYISSRSR